MRHADMGVHPQANLDKAPKWSDFVTSLHLSFVFFSSTITETMYDALQGKGFSKCLVLGELMASRKHESVDLVKKENRNRMLSDCGH